MVEFKSDFIDKYVKLFGADKARLLSIDTAAKGNQKNSKFELYKNGQKSMSLVAKTDASGNLIKLQVTPIKQ